MVTRSEGDEADLVRCQAQRGTGVFDCDVYEVFSDRAYTVSEGPPAIETSVLAMPLRSQEGVAGALTAGFLNTEIFMKAWEEIGNKAEYLDHDWIVKVDPDAVFFPGRMRDLATARGWGGPLYLRNCPDGERAREGGLALFGAVEVLSREALQAYTSGWSTCRDQLDWTLLGEDYYLQQCLDLLGVASADASEVLEDGYCKMAPVDCKDSAVAFHPYKMVGQYMQCYEEAGGEKMPPRVDGPPQQTCTAPPYEGSLPVAAPTELPAPAGADAAPGEPPQTLPGGEEEQVEPTEAPAQPPAPAGGGEQTAETTLAPAGGNDEACKAVGGDECVFPFIYKGVVYQGCTDMDYIKPWCSLKVTEKNEHVLGSFGDCGDACLVQASPQPFNPFDAEMGPLPDPAPDGDANGPADPAAAPPPPPDS